MTESEFTQLADNVFAHIEQILDKQESDFDYGANGPVLEIEFPDDSQIIINRHAANQEIWLAAPSGGYHYSFQNGKWLSQRDGSELFNKLAELIRLGCGQTITFG